MTRPSHSGAGALADEAEMSDHSEGQANPATPPFVPDRSIALVGMPGSGKTTMGRRIAKTLGLPFKDADSEIQAACGGRTVREIFAEWGEAEFRRIERQVIARLLRSEGPIVLATGGGAYMNAETRALMRDVAVTLWLRANFDVLLGRVIKKRSKRPLLAEDPRGALEKLLREREPLYAEADITIESAAAPQSHTTETALAALGRYFKERENS